MTGIEDRITGVLREALSLEDFEGDQLYEGGINPRELAAAVVAELGLTEEDRFCYAFGQGDAIENRWVTDWEKAE